MQAIYNKWRETDKMYLLLCMALSAISIIVLFSLALHGNIGYSGLGNLRPAFTQIAASLAGLAAAVFLSFVNYRKIAENWPWHVALCWGLVLLTFIPGVGYAPGTSGSQSWIAMPFGMSFQPTELAKISFCLSLAYHLNIVHDKLSSPKVLLPVLAHILLPVLVVHLQGDDGTAMVFAAIGCFMLFMAGLNRWVVVSCVSAAAIAMPFIWVFVLKTHQKERILGLFFPDVFSDTVMHQQLQAHEAITAGGFWGQGLFQPEHHYVPRSENDFIFSYIAQSCGFIGSMLLLCLLFALLFKTLHLMRKTPSRMGAYICAGVFAVLFFQSFVNIGMNLMLVPVAGLTLPFVSAGGTSALALYIMIGLVLNVERQRRTHLYENIL